MRKRNSVLIIAPLLILLLFFLFSFYVSLVMTSPLALHIDASPKVISNRFEEIQFTTNDKLTLRGWFFPSTEQKAIIMVHGLLTNRVNGEYFGQIIAKELVDQGFSVLVYDTRAHGKSEGNRVAFGAKEGNDIVAAVDFLKGKGFKPNQIGIIADSTGAVSTLMVIDQLRDIGAIVADTPAADFSKIISARLWKEKHIPTFFHPVIFFFNKIFFGVDINSIKPIEKVRNSTETKILYLHAAKDETIPLQNSQDLVKIGNRDSRLVVFPQGLHIETFKSDPQLYRNEVYPYLKENLTE